MSNDSNADSQAVSPYPVLDLARLRHCLEELRDACAATGGRVDVTIHGASDATIDVLSLLAGASLHPAYHDGTEWDAVRVNFGVPIGELNVFSRMRPRRGR